MNLKNKRVLVIDDDNNFVSLVKRILEAKGIVVDSAENISSAQSIVENKLPDLVILDLNLAAGENGVQYLKMRSDHSYLKAIPTIVCSKDSSERIVHRVIEMGAEDYIVKPIRPDWLIQKINKHLKTEEYLQIIYGVEGPEIEVKCWAEVTAIGEASCKIRSPLNFSKPDKFELEMKKINDIDKIRLLRANFRSRPTADQGVYETSCTILGISEKEAHKIRKLTLKWKSAS